MTKLDLKNIAAALSSAHNISEADAEQFLKTVFEVIADALRQESQVKVKGLGTFKLLDVPEREMIDVNSGERIVIEPRQRISFTPDSVLRDIINKPFLFFDTVVLNDGVVFDDEQESEENEDDYQDADVSSADSENIESIEDTETDTEEISEKAQTTVSEDTAESAVDDTDETESADEVKEEDVNPTEDNTKLSSDANVMADESENEEKEDNSEQKIHEAAPTAVNEALQNAREVMDDIESGNLGSEEDAVSVSHSENKVRRNMWIIFITASVFIAAAAFLIGIYAGGSRLNWFGSNEDIKTDTVSVSPVIKDTLHTDSLISDTIVTDSIITDTLVKQDSIITEKKTKENTIDPDFYDALDGRVRTGAYRIVGIDTAVIVIKGQTLKSITKAYLGKGMECYVETLNGVESVQPGDTLKIPKLKWRKKH